MTTRIKIAISHRPGSFSNRWIEYCKETGIDYKIVNCYDNDIIKQVSDCDAFMWHFSNTSSKDTLFAKQLIYSLSNTCKVVFPDFNTAWHFDDKVGQKYLLESINAPLVPTYIFYNKHDALEWISNSAFPKVFKLRRGAGSSNVKLVQNKNKAKKIVKKAFKKGFSQSNSVSMLKERFRKFRIGKMSFLQVIGGVYRIFLPSDYSKIQGKERGYTYFQDFIPNNQFDIRVIVIDNKAFAVKRMVRPNDFRASGSGNIIYDRTEINLKVVELSFNISKKIKSDCVAFDYVFYNDEPLITEISYGFTVEAYDPCPGYWDSEMNWHEGNFNPQTWMVDNVVNAVKLKKREG